MRNIFFIAEAGVNHNGSLSIAKKLAEAAKASGADAVKFQTFSSRNLVSHYAEKAAYQKVSTKRNETQLEMLQHLELGLNAHLELVQFCRSIGIQFLSTAFDMQSIDLLQQIGIKVWKIPSGEITNLPYLQKIGALHSPIILSTGMASLGEVEAAIRVIEDAGTKRELITVLHCTTEYPAPVEEVNLNAMCTMGAAFGVAYGYSDHTDGIAVPIAAAALGATIIEKHFTLDRTMKGPDHKASLEPDELAELVKAIRIVEVALGDGIKRPTESEIKNRISVRKSIVAARRIALGEVFTESSLVMKRPGFGISPMELNAVIGRKASRDYDIDEVIEW